MHFPFFFDCFRSFFFDRGGAIGVVGWRGAVVAGGGAVGAAGRVGEQRNGGGGEN